MPMFFIDLKVSQNNKSIFNINRLLNTVVVIEPPRTKREIPQCERCQRFGHTKKYCHLGYRCVKCTGTHQTTECPRSTRDDQVKCINCGGNHPANYKGCIVYQNLREKLYPALRAKSSSKSQTKTNSFVKPNVSFADLLNQPDQPIITTPPQSNDMAEMKEMMKGLMSQMSTMLNLLTAVISKLT